LNFNVTQPLHEFELPLVQSVELLANRAKMLKNQAFRFGHDGILAQFSSRGD
jgi:hypothetical protein